MRTARAIAVLPTAATIAGLAVGLAIAARKVLPLYVEERHAWLVIIAAALSVLFALLYALVRRLPPRAGALALDNYHRLEGRLANALAFNELASSERDPMMDIAIEDACQVAGEGLSARRAVRIPIPGELAVSGLVLLAVAGLSMLEVHTPREAAAAKVVSAIDALEMTEDDLELFRDAVEELERGNQTPEIKKAIQKFNQLIEDIAKKRLSRKEAFRRMREIEEELLKSTEQERKAMRESLKEMAKELQKSELAKPTAEALKKNKLAAARKEVKKLADALRGKGKKKPNKAQLERLRKALKRAAKANKKALERLNERRAELRKQLLRKKKTDKPDAGKKQSKREKRLLRKKKRELERLDREAKRREASRRKLSRLDRQLAKAAANLLRDLGATAEDLEGLAEDLNRLEQEQMSDKEKEELRRRLQELRELIKKQGKGGQKRRKLLRRFGRRARGGKGAKGGQGRPGQGQGRPGQGDDGGQLRPGKGQKGQGQKGMGQGQGQGEGSGGVGIGPGGKPIPVEMPGGSGSGSGEGDQPGSGAGQGGKKWGSGSANPLGEATDIKGGTRDVRAEGLDSKSGPTDAQVIVSTADRGFRGKPYKKLFKAYKTVAEDQIDREKIPDGMRFYVRRYFQLIRPRE